MDCIAGNCMYHRHNGEEVITYYVCECEKCQPQERVMHPQDITIQEAAELYMKLLVRPKIHSTGSVIIDQLRRALGQIDDISREDLLTTMELAVGLIAVHDMFL